MLAKCCIPLMYTRNLGMPDASAFSLSRVWSNERNGTTIKHFSSTLAQRANHRNRFSSHCSVRSPWADSSKSRNSSFFVFYWSSPPLKGQGVTDCIVFAPLHALSYCWVHAENNRLNVLPSLVTKSFFLSLHELIFSINVKHLFTWNNVYSMLG